MGMIRFLLAVYVYVAHSQPLLGISSPGNDGHIVVQAFFILSGFYMAMILTEKYTSNHRFYKNRFLRLYPAYFFILVIGAFLSMHPSYKTLDPFAFIVILFSNMTAIGLDVLMFFGIHNGQLTFAYEMRDFPPASSYFVMLPAWSLGLEIWFYVLAPFLVRRKWYVLLGIACVSLLARYVTYEAGLTDVIWVYRYFPFEIPLFLGGVFSYRLYAILKTLGAFKVLGYISLAILLISTYFMPPALPYYCIVMGCTPLTFLLTKTWKWDRFIGDITYPFYLLHLVAINFNKGLMPNALLFGLCVLCASGIVLFIERPFSRFRS